MEDNKHAIFHTEPEQLFYKSILTSEEAFEINKTLMRREGGWKDVAMVIANGIRPYQEVNLDKDIPEVKERLVVVLRDYFPDVVISDDARFYNH